MRSREKMPAPKAAVFLAYGSALLALVAAIDECPVDNSGMLHLTSATDMRAAATVCTNVSGIRTVLVGALDCVPSSVKGVKSLDNLETLLASINAFLHVECLEELSSLQGLASVSQLSGLIVRRNPNLQSVSGLNGLRVVHGQLAISQNWRLLGIDGLQSLTRIGGFLSIDRNPNMTSIAGLASLHRIDGHPLFGDYALSISENWMLTSLAGLRSLAVISHGTVHIEGNRQLCFAGYPQWADEGLYKRRPFPLTIPADRGVDWRSLFGNTSSWLWRWGMDSIPTLKIRNNAAWENCQTVHCSDSCITGAGCWGPSLANLCGSCRNDSLVDTCADISKTASDSSTSKTSTAYWPPPWEGSALAIFIVIILIITILLLFSVGICYRRCRNDPFKKDSFKIPRLSSTHRNELIHDYSQNGLLREGNATHLHIMARQSTYGDEDQLTFDDFLPDEELVRKVEGIETTFDDSEKGASFSGFAGVKVGGIQYNYPRDQLRPLGTDLGTSRLWKVYEAEAKRIISGLKRTKVVVLELKEDADKEEQDVLLHHIEPMKLAHANVLNVMGLCLERQPLLAVCEASGQGDLKTYLIRHRWDSRSLFRHGQTLQMATNIAAGLSCLHSAGIVHCDLAARNCQVTANHIVKVGDYGLSKGLFPDDYYRHKDLDEAIPLRWMAPAQITEKDDRLVLNKSTKESNIWAFGVTLWELLSFAEQPHSNISDDELLQVLLDDQVHYQLDNPLQSGQSLTYEEAPVELLPIVERCLASLPHDRPNCADLAEELNALRRLAKEKEAITSPSPSIVPKVSKESSVPLNLSSTNTAQPKQPIAVLASKPAKAKKVQTSGHRPMADVDVQPTNDSPVRSALRKSEESVQTKKRVDFKVGEQLTEVLTISALSVRSLEDEDETSERVMANNGVPPSGDESTSQTASGSSIPVTDIDAAIDDYQTVPSGPGWVYKDTLQRSKKRKKISGQVTQGSKAETAEETGDQIAEDGQSQDVGAAVQAEQDPAKAKLTAMMW